MQDVFVCRLVMIAAQSGGRVGRLDSPKCGCIPDANSRSWRFESKELSGRTQSWHDDGEEIEEEEHP